jgi:hypothetical protein
LKINGVDVWRCGTLGAYKFPDSGVLRAATISPLYETTTENGILKVPKFVV